MHKKGSTAFFLMQIGLSNCLEFKEIIYLLLAQFVLLLITVN